MSQPFYNIAGVSISSALVTSDLICNKARKHWGPERQCHKTGINGLVFSKFRKNKTGVKRVDEKQIAPQSF